MLTANLLQFKLTDGESGRTVFPPPCFTETSVFDGGENLFSCNNFQVHRGFKLVTLGS